MNYSWHVGRIGPMTITLHYTWLPLAALGLWLLALLRLPPILDGGWVLPAWALAVAALLLYGGGLLLVEAARTRLSGVYTAAWPRPVRLFPFGAAVPHPLAGIRPARAAAISLVGPLIMGLLGAIYWVGADALAGGPTPALTEVVRDLAYAHLACAALNLLPGLPLAGGWAFVALLRGASVHPVQALTLAQRLGWLVFVGLATIGGAQVIQAGDWVLALGILAMAWALREGANTIEEQALTGQMLDQLTAGEIMQPPPAILHPENTLVQAFRSGTKYGTADVVPVEDAGGQFVGLLPLALEEQILQGTWPRVPVGAAMRPASQFATVAPDTALSAVLTMLGHTTPVSMTTMETATPLGYVPVVAQGHLQGVIGWDQVAAYDQLAAQAGVQEATTLAEVAAPLHRRLAWLGVLLGFFLLVLLVAGAGNRLVSPTLVVPPTPTPPPNSVIIFSQPTPLDGALIGRGDLPIAVTIADATPIQTVTMTLDGQPLTVTVDQPGGTQVTATAPATLVLLGPHTIQVTVQDTAGLTAKFAWTVHVVPVAPDTPSPDQVPGNQQ